MFCAYYPKSAHLIAIIYAQTYSGSSIQKMVKEQEQQALTLNRGLEEEYR